MHFRLLSIVLIGLFWLLTVPTTAQDEIPAPQLLYRSDNQLILLDGYTGEKTALPFEITTGDRFEWSPDGQYLLAWLQDGESYTHCLNLYDVDAEMWLYDEPIACAVGDAAFSPDITHIVYSTEEEDNGILWVYNLADETTQEIYRTPDQEYGHESGISDIEWSPTGTYLTFVNFHWIMGGTLNYFNIMNFESRNYTSLIAPDAYYASYDPIWSADDASFLIRLKEQYVTSGTLPHSNHQGNVYLVNSDSGGRYRLTYTPTSYESDIHWTEDGRIAFNIVTTQELTVEQAKQVTVVPNEAIVTPEPVDPEEFFKPRNMIMSPDENVGAWVTSVPGGQYDLNIGTANFSRLPNFSIPIKDQYWVIGWRPSDYPYTEG